MLRTVDIKTGTVKSTSNQKTFLTWAKQVIEIIVSHAIENSARGELSDLSVVSYKFSRADFLRIITASYEAML